VATRDFSLLSQEVPELKVVRSHPSIPALTSTEDLGQGTEGTWPKISTGKAGK
jgi:hypothetical protein